MSSFFDHLEEQLRTAAQARTGAGPAPAGPPPRRSRWAWLHAGLRSAPVVVAVATTAVIVVAALVFLGHGKSPANQSAAAPPAPSWTSYARMISDWGAAPRQELRVLNQAETDASRSRACRNAGFPQQTPAIHGTPSQALLAQLAVLRRAATAADRLPPHALDGIGGDYVGAARLAVRANGASYYLVPARNDPRLGGPGPACLAAHRVALLRLLPQLPASMRANAAKLQAEQIDTQQAMYSRPATDVVCFVVVGSNFGSNTCGATAAQVRNGQTPQLGGGPQQPSAGIAPDGVATVVLAWATPGHHHFTVTAPVQNNVYVAAQPPNGRLSTVTWRAADGHVLNVISGQTGANIRQVCRNRRSPKCIAALAKAYSQLASGSGYGSSYSGASSSSESSSAPASASSSSSRSSAP